MAELWSNNLRFSLFNKHIIMEAASLFVAEEKNKKRKAMWKGGIHH